MDTGDYDLRLAGICRDCMKRLAVDQRLTIPVQTVQVNQLEEFTASSMAGVQFPGHLGLGRGGHHGTTRITYKVAKTVKETIDDGTGSQMSHSSQGAKKA